MAPLMRQSCDRCHHQKLRCTRGGNKFGTCDRCIRRGVQCVYSCSLPKGRPSMYSVTRKSQDNRTQQKDTTTVRSSHSSSRRPRGSQDGSTTKCPSFFEHIGQSNDISLQPDLDSLLLAHTMDQELNKFTESGPTSDPSLGALAWDEISTNHFSNSIPSRSTQAAMGLGQSFDNLSAVLSWDPSLGNESSAIHGYPHAEVGSDSDEKQNSTEDRNRDDSTRSIITQLSQLIMRFSRLHRSSCGLFRKSSCPHLDISQIHDNDMTGLTSSSEWLDPLGGNQRAVSIHSSKEETTSNILCRVFSASHTFLEALHGLRTNAGVDCNIVLRTSPPTPPGLSPNGSSPFTLHTASSSYPHLPGPDSNNVVRHLMVTCYTMLLSIYVAVLSSLEYDARAGGPMDGANTGDIRQASVVQLCSSLIERQQVAMDTYLAANRCQAASWATQADPNYDQTNAAAEEEMGNLSTEVQQRLARLQNVLYL